MIEPKLKVFPSFALPQSVSASISGKAKVTAEITDAGRPKIVAQATWKGGLSIVRKRILWTVAGSVLLAGSPMDFFVSVPKRNRLP